MTFMLRFLKSSVCAFFQSSLLPLWDLSRKSQKSCNNRATDLTPSIISHLPNMLYTTETRAGMSVAPGWRNKAHRTTLTQYYCPRFFTPIHRNWFLKYFSGMDVLHAALHVLPNDVQTFVQKWGQYRTACTPRLDILHMQDDTASRNKTWTSRSFHLITHDFIRAAIWRIQPNVAWMPFLSRFFPCP